MSRLKFTEFTRLNATGGGEGLGIAEANTGGGEGLGIAEANTGGGEGLGIAEANTGGGEGLGIAEVLGFASVGGGLLSGACTIAPTCWGIGTALVTS